MTAFIFWGDLPIKETLNINTVVFINDVVDMKVFFQRYLTAILYIFYEVTNSYEFIWPN